MHLGILTSGGDCAGLNAVIRGAVRGAIVQYGDQVTGFLEGWRGILDGRSVDLTIDNTRGLLHSGGTILKSSRVNPLREEKGAERVRRMLAAKKIDVLLVAGGDGSARLSYALGGQGVPILHLPKTIDNDIPLTDHCFGFDTALTVVVEALDRLSTTAESHDRIIVCEVMGNESGSLAFYGGLAGGADYIFIPEVPADLEGACEVIRLRHRRGRDFSIVVVAEGTKFPAGVRDFPPPPHGPGRAAPAVAEFLEKRTGYETRYVVLGHVQRGGTPTAFDRVLATRAGTAAVDAAHEGLTGKMLAFQGREIVPVELKDVAEAPRRALLPAQYERIKVFFG